MVLGEHHLVDKEVFEQSRGVEAIYLHPKYKSMFLEGIYDTPPDYDIGKLPSVGLKSPQTAITNTRKIFFNQPNDHLKEPVVLCRLGI